MYRISGGEEVCSLAELWCSVSVQNLHTHARPNKHTVSVHSVGQFKIFILTPGRAVHSVHVSKRMHDSEPNAALVLELDRLRADLGCKRAATVEELASRIQNINQLLLECDQDEGTSCSSGGIARTLSLPPAPATCHAGGSR